MDMPHRPLGGSGLEVSRLSLGSWRTFDPISHEERHTYSVNSSKGA